MEFHFNTPIRRFPTNPFYLSLHDLMKPTKLKSGSMPPCSSFGPSGVADFMVKLCEADLPSKKNDRTIQLRLMQLQRDGENQKKYDSSTTVIVNNRCVIVPQYDFEPQLLALINLTEYVTSGENWVNIIASTFNVPKDYDIYFSVEMLRKRTVSEMVKIVGSRPQIENFLTRLQIVTVIQQSILSECMMHESKLEVSLLCPLMKQRMKIPCRSKTCSHFRCFDATNFIAMNEANPTWKCPICCLKINFQDLAVDSYFLNILDSVPKNIIAVEIDVLSAWNTKEQPKNTMHFDSEGSGKINSSDDEVEVIWSNLKTI